METKSTQQPTDLQTPAFKVGDRVQWINFRSKGSGFSMSSRAGTILSLRPYQAEIRDDRSKKRVIVALRKLEQETTPGPVTKVVFGMAGQPLPEHLQASAAPQSAA